MPRARYEFEKLRSGEDKIEDLRDEEQQHCLAEVSEDCDYGKRHAGKIAESVAYKHLRRISMNEENINNICNTLEQDDLKYLISYRIRAIYLKMTDIITSFI